MVQFGSVRFQVVTAPINLVQINNRELQVDSSSEPKGPLNRTGGISVTDTFFEFHTPPPAPALP